MSIQNWQTTFQKSIQKIAELSDLKIEQEALAKMQTHLQLLMKWNRVHNLTAASSVELLAEEHYADCILALHVWKAQSKSKETIFDLGAGNGFPGIIAAILYPHLNLALVESSRKKCSFLRTATATLGLSNVEILNDRVEKLNGMKLAVTRAAFSEPNLNELAASFESKGELALLTVPGFPSDKWLIDKSPWIISSRQEYQLSSGAKRCVVVLQRK